MKRLLPLTLSFLCFSPLAAKETANSSIEIRSAAFFPSSHLFREIYGNGSACYEVEAATKLHDHIEGWANLDWFPKHGKSVGFRDPTKISITNLSLGVRLAYPFAKRYKLYAGVGPSFGYVWIRNTSACLNQNTSRLAFGGVIKSGIYCYINHLLFIDVFVDYLYEPSPFKKHVNIGGLKTGAGLGVRF